MLSAKKPGYSWQQVISISAEQPAIGSSGGSQRQ